MDEPCVKRCRSLFYGRTLALALLAVGFAHPVSATTYYVDASSSGCAGSPCADSNNGTSEATAFATPKGCINKPLVSGDVCLLKTGSYPAGSSVANLQPAYDICGLHGSSGNPITFAAMPGHTPVVCVNNGSGGCTGDGVSFGSKETCPDNGGVSNVVIDGIHFQGLVYIRGGSFITLKNSDIQGAGGWSDGNCDTLRIERSSDIQIDHNLIHGFPSATACVTSGTIHEQQLQIFVATRLTIEYNTFDQADGIPRFSAIFLKDGANSTIIRYNDFKKGNITGIYQNNSGSGPAGNQIYGNVLRSGWWWAMHLASGTLVYNNTFIGGGLTWGADPGTAAESLSQVYNNVVSNPQPSNAVYCENSAGCNVVVTNAGSGSAWSKIGGYIWDFNAYDSDGAYSPNHYGGGTDQTSLAGWRSAFAGAGQNGTTGRDAHSIAGNAGTSGSPCTFASGTDTPYHVAPSTLCSTGACTNWPTCSAATTEFGAYGVTSCVGYTCGTTGRNPDTTPPVRSAAAPSGALTFGTVQTSLSLSTSENATCKYALTPGTAYAAMTHSFTTTGQMSHSTIVTGLANGGAYSYYVRCSDSAGNSNTDDYPITFSVSTTATVSSCATPPPGTIFCDDFEDTTTLATKYTDYNDASGRFVPTSGEAHSGTHAMSARYDPGVEDSGYLWYNFGRNPAGSKTQASTDFTDIYWRVWMKVARGFQGNPQKFSRARVLARSDYTDAATGHVWNGSALNLLLDPATGVGTDGTTLLTSGYNDFAHYNWLGAVDGATQVYDSSHQDRWQCVEVHMKLNTPGQSDGVFEYWVDGSLDAQRTGLNWRGSYTGYGINHFALENWWNGGLAPTTEYRYFDDLMISTQRIGCASGGVTTPPSSVNGLRRTDQH
jgi:hypothetical protein